VKPVVTVDTVTKDAEPKEKKPRIYNNNKKHYPRRLIEPPKPIYAEEVKIKL
jgi:hypothetical protein